MQILYTVLAIAAALYATYFMRQRAKSDAVVGELVIQPKKEELQDAADIAKLTEEVKNAKIDYAAAAERARAKYLESRNRSRQ